MHHCSASPQVACFTQIKPVREFLFLPRLEWSLLPWPCFSVTPILISPILLLTDISLNATVIYRTRGECSEMFLEARSKGQVNGYLCANTDSDPCSAASVVERCHYHPLTQRSMAQHRDYLEQCRLLALPHLSLAAASTARDASFKT